MSSILHAAIVTAKSVTVTFLDTGDSFTIPANDGQYGVICDALKAGATTDDLRVLTDKKSVAVKATETYGDFTVSDDGITYKGRMLNNGLTRRIIGLFRDNGDVAPLIAFFGRLLQNPRRTAVERLYDFMEANDLPVTADGHFLAYKIVKNDYKDIYSRTMDNSIGNVVEVPSNEVDEDIDRTCSHGLHVCSKGYLPHYGNAAGEGGDRIVLVKVDPAHVVAIPRDYNDAKMRVYRYVVIGELKDKSATDIIEGRALASRSGYGDTSGRVEFHDSWDSHGCCDDEDEDEDEGEDEDAFNEGDFWGYNRFFIKTAKGSYAPVSGDAAESMFDEADDVYRDTTDGISKVTEQMIEDWVDDHNA